MQARVVAERASAVSARPTAPKAPKRLTSAQLFKALCKRFGVIRRVKLKKSAHGYALALDSSVQVLQEEVDWYEEHGDHLAMSVPASLAISVQNTACWPHVGCVHVF